MPDDLRCFSEAVCDHFNIRGICDPLYIANVTAYELGRGDGCSNFSAARRAAGDDFSQRCDQVASRLAFAYSSSIGTGKEDLLKLARTLLKPQAALNC